MYKCGQYLQNSFFEDKFLINYFRTIVRKPHVLMSQNATGGRGGQKSVKKVSHII
jgi:hypothetical protein